MDNITETNETLTNEAVESAEEIVAAAPVEVKKKKSSVLGTIFGGLLGLILGLGIVSACVLLTGKMYFICLITLPILSGLFIRLFRGSRGVGSIIYVAFLTLLGTLLAGFILEAGTLITNFDLPWYEIYRLAGLMIVEFSTYFPFVWTDLTKDVINIIINVAYIVIGLIFTWEFIFKGNQKKEAVKAVNTGNTADSENDGDDQDGGEYEYVYEDELEPEDDVVETK